MRVYSRPAARSASSGSAYIRMYVCLPSASVQSCANRMSTGRPVPRSAALAHDRHDLVAGVDEFLHLEPPLVPRARPIGHELPHPVDAIVGLALGPTGKRRHVPYELRSHRVLV